MYEASNPTQTGFVTIVCGSYEYFELIKFLPCSIVANDFLPAVPLTPNVILLTTPCIVPCNWFFVLVLHRHNDEQFVRGILKIVGITGSG